jgi:hypothetical protein
VGLRPPSWRSGGLSPFAWCSGVTKSALDKRSERVYITSMNTTARHLDEQQARDRAEVRSMTSRWDWKVIRKWDGYHAVSDGAGAVDRMGVVVATYRDGEEITA